MKNQSDRISAIIGLQHRGYDRDFVIDKEHLLCLQEGERLGPLDFEIAETLQFPEGPDAGDITVIYAIHSVHSDLRGILTTSYSTFTKGLGLHLWTKLSHALC